MRIVVVVVSVVGALVVLGGAGAGYYLAGRAQVNDAIRASNADIDRINADGDSVEKLANGLPSLPNFSQSQSDAQLRTQVTQFDDFATKALATMDDAGSAVTDGQTRLADAQRKVAAASASWLTLGQRGSLDREKRRLGYEQQALTKAGTLVKVARAQVQAVRDLVDAAGAYLDVGGDVQTGNYQGALTAYTSVHQLLTKASADSADAHLPSVWTTFLANFGKLADDTRDVVQALQNGDDATAQSKAGAVEKDAQAVSNVDTSSLGQDTYLTDLGDQIKQLEDKANST